MDSVTTKSVDRELLSTPVASVLGLFGGVGIAAVGMIFQPPQSTAILAALLAMIYGVYLGFALLDGRTSALTVESLFIAVGLTLTVCGSLYGPTWIAVGLLLHGLWDVLHHQRLSFAGAHTVPRWYVPFCAIADLLGATAIFVSVLLGG